MGCGTKETGIILEAVKAFWGIKHCRSIKTVAGAALAGGDYFDVNYFDNEFNEVLGYIWFDDGVAVDPAPAGKTSIGFVDLGGAETAAEIASEIQVVAAAHAQLTAEISADDDETVEIQNKVLGLITPELDSGTGFVFTVSLAGLGGFLGKTAQGGTTVSAETQTFEIKSDQTAEQVLDDINLGNAISAEMGLIQVTKERLLAIIGGVTGGILKPAGGTELVGFGTSKLYKSMAALGGQLIMHPIRLADNDHSRDVIMHKCAPLPNDINYSGSENQVLNVTFKAYIDEDIREEINVMAFGDWTQDLVT